LNGFGGKVTTNRRVEGGVTGKVRNLVMRPLEKSGNRVHRNALLKKRDELLTIGEQEWDALSYSMRSPDAVEQAAHSVEQDVATWTVNLRFETLREVDEALKRMEEGEFGTCQCCGKPIASIRLKAIPWARFCVACQDLDAVTSN
jgi:DnaK suppressor protein